MRQRTNRLRYAAGLLMVALPLGAVVPVPGPAGAEETARARPAEQEIVDLGVLPGGTTSFAYDLNDHGEVVGSSGVGNTTSHAFVWRRGRMTDLGTLGGGPRDSSVATGINEQGQIVGFSTVAADVGDFTSHAVLWSDGQLTDLGTLGGPDSVATAINDRGEVVGRSTTANGETHAFLWRRGRMVDLGAPDGTTFSSPAAINTRGQVVAAVGLAVPYAWHGGVWSPLEPAPGAEFASAQDNNDRGHAAGYVVVGGVAGSRSVVWRGGAPVDLGFPEDEGSQAAGINDRGQVVGVSYETGAFLWEGGTTTRLPALVGGATAEAINDRGVVAGYSPTQAGIEPRYHAVIWR